MIFSSRASKAEQSSAGKVQASATPGSLSSVPPRNLQVGSFVIAVGTPFGLSQTGTSGLVSALGHAWLGRHGHEDFIQSEAAINPANSGGGLINLKGELVGVNTALTSPGGINVGS